MGNNIFMEIKKAEEIFPTRSSDDRRRVPGRRLFREQGYLDHNPERRVKKIKRRMLGDRMDLIFER
jgi:hypothetical protein